MLHPAIAPSSAALKDVGSQIRSLSSVVDSGVRDLAVCVAVGLDEGRSGGPPGKLV